ncbi:MAG: FAD-dependent oxidoreductase, partial [Candidatus Omnitrophica bacterium]|nr:FAD-dependent oxidoreductase [Candidatus Omnitrophota bacterium]
KNKRVIVIGGGDTGADCVGTAHRQGARSVSQIEVMPKPESCRSIEYPWPKYPLLLKTSTSHQEGGQRQWSILTKEFSGSHGDVKKIVCSRVEFTQQAGNACPVAKEIVGSEFEIDADMVVLAVGFLHPEHSPLLSSLGVCYDGRGNVKTDEHCMTSAKGVFSTGDMRRGQSLIVWAIAEGRTAAHAIDTWLMGRSNLPVI